MIDRRGGHCRHAGDRRRRGAGELVIATRESADVTNPVEEYNNKYLHRIDMTYALDASDFGSDEYRVFVADTDNLRGDELRGALIDKLYSAGVRVVAVPDGAAAGVLLDNYLQTGNTGSLDSYLSVLPRRPARQRPAPVGARPHATPVFPRRRVWGQMPAVRQWAKR